MPDSRTSTPQSDRIIEGLAPTPALHPAPLYARFRPEYPPEFFEPLRRELKDASTAVELGAGTGLALISARKAGVRGRWIAVEPDAAMADQGIQSTAGEAGLQWVRAPAEQTGLVSACADALLIASAYHWMPRPAVDDEILRLLKPGALALIGEYQFPQAVDRPELNEAVRKGFNQTWRLPQQKPRGRLRDLLRPLAVAPEVAQFQDLTGGRSTPSAFERMLTGQQFLGLLFSQARFEAWVRAQPAPPEDLHQRVTEQLFPLLPEGPWPYRFRLQAFLLRRAGPQPVGML